MSFDWFNPDPTPSDSFCFDYNTSFDTSQSIDVSNSYYDSVTVIDNVNWTPTVTGNTVNFALDAQAIGNNGLVDVSVTAVTDASYASLTMSGTVITV